MRDKKSKSRRGSKGQGLVEFAITLPLFLVLFFVAVEAGRALYQWHTQHHAAREALREATVVQEDKILQTAADRVTEKLASGVVQNPETTVLIPGVPPYPIPGATLSDSPIIVNVKGDFESALVTFFNSFIPNLLPTQLNAVVSGYSTVVEPAKPLDDPIGISSIISSSRSYYSDEGSESSYSESSYGVSSFNDSSYSHFSSETSDAGWPSKSESIFSSSTYSSSYYSSGSSFLSHFSSSTYTTSSEIRSSASSFWSSFRSSYTEFSKSYSNSLSPSKSHSVSVFSDSKSSFSSYTFPSSFQSSFEYSDSIFSESSFFYPSISESKSNYTESSYSHSQSGWPSKSAYTESSFSYNVSKTEYSSSTYSVFSSSIASSHSRYNYNLGEN